MKTSLNSGNIRKDVRFGIVGTNFVSDWLIEGGREDSRFRVTAVYSRTQETGDKFAQRHGIPHVFTSLEEMLEGDLVDAVYIASPNALHASQAIACMKRKKHVLCEKPIASNLKELDAMIAVAQENKVVLMEAMKPTLTPNFKVVMENLQRLGRIRRYFSSYCQYSSRYDKYKAGEVLNAFRPELSNGALMDIGVYTIYPMVLLFGAPDRIHASATLLESGVDGAGSVTFKYKEMLATVLYSKIADSHLPTEIQGEQGTLILDRINTISDVTFRPRKGKRLLLGHPKVKNEYYYEVAEFIDLIENNKQESDINSLDVSRKVMQVLDEIRHQTGVHYPADDL